MAQPAARRMRSAPAPQGMSPVSATARHSNNTASWVWMGDLARCISRMGPVPSQFQLLPARVSGSAPSAPAKQAPMPAKAMKAADMMASDPSRACAAERDRPRPAFTSARPAMARGASSKSAKVIAAARADAGGVVIGEPRALRECVRARPR